MRHNLKHGFVILCAGCLGGISACTGSDTYDEWLVKDGTPRAIIVTAPEPPRLTKLAAEDLRDYIQKVSGAELPIRQAPDPEFPVTIYVGRSSYTDQKQITDDGLDYGAYRMVSGPDWLALIGQDADFEPNELCAVRQNEMQRAQEVWEELSGGMWVNPMTRAFRRYHGRTGIWNNDLGGSYNAVCGFLRDLGVRWYMPGALGEVVPLQTSIRLPRLDRTVRPDYPLRHWHGTYFLSAVPDLLWERRLGMFSEAEVLGPHAKHTHGLTLVHGHPAMRAAHPDYYAWINGERDTQTHGTGHACFSAPGLEQEAVRFARAMFDQMDVAAVSLWPQDGLRPCRCEQCEQLPTSDMVWGFVERVAREVYKTHPDRLITCGAYASYRAPPESIDRFSPNVAVFITNVGRPFLEDPERWDEFMELVEGWRVKLAPHRLLRVENNLYVGGSRPAAFPLIHTRAFAKELRALKGVSRGDWNEVPRIRIDMADVYFAKPGLNHLNLYVNAAFLWDADQDLDLLLDEYYRLFYGPAAELMQQAFEFAEGAYPRALMNKRYLFGEIGFEERIRFLELLQAAREVAGATVYGQRIDVILSELQPLESVRHEATMTAARGEVPVFTGLRTIVGHGWEQAMATFMLDGKLEEPFWRRHFYGAGMRDAISGGRPELTTSFYIRYYNDHMYFGVICREQPGREPVVTTVRNGDPAILDGDYIEILLETDIHSYYRLVVNPAGALLDMDMAEETGARERWSSNAEVAAHVNDDFWSVEIRIPVVGEAEGATDPLHFVVGTAPSHGWPWHFNIGRRRLLDAGSEFQAFSPTGEESLLDPLKFGRYQPRL
ncbi:MAG: DUF4838 domain-containing protein [Kiritimatiellia bacterium]